MRAIGQVPLQLVEEEGGFLLLAEAGVAKMTLYKQFGSKEELIAAVLERLAGTITSGLSQRLTAATWTSPIPSGWPASCTCCSKVSW